jgi:transposase
MIKLKRMLQLLDAGKSMNEICRELSMSKRTVHSYKQRVAATGVPLQSLRKLDDAQLNTILQPKSSVPQPDERKGELEKDLENYLREWKKPYVSVLLLWEEYRKDNPDGYQYTQFKKYLKEYKKSQELSYHNVYNPGEEMQIDYAGDKLYYRNKSTGTWIEVVVLCCIMPYSNKAFAMGAHDATQENLFHCLSRCMSYFGRVPRIAKSDNMSQWVKRGGIYERSFTESVDEWATHYDIIPDMTRIGKPRDKAPVESLVDQVYKYVYARIRNQVFYSLNELNEALFSLIEEYNSRAHAGQRRVTRRHLLS